MTHSTTRDLVCKMPTAIAALRWTSTMSISIRRSDWIACCWADQLRMHSPLPIVWSKLQQPHCTNPSLPDWFRSTAIGCTIVPVFVCVCTIRMVCVRLPMKFYVLLFVCLESGVCVCVVFYCLVCGIHRTQTHTHAHQPKTKRTHLQETAHRERPQYAPLDDDRIRVRGNHMIFDSFDGFREW